MENIIKEGRTRREFLKGAGAVVAGGVVVGVVGSQLSCEELPGVANWWTPDSNPLTLAPRAKAYLVHDSIKCDNCKSCMSACSLANYGKGSQALSRRQVVHSSWDQGPGDVRQTDCRQCTEVPCIEVCPSGAFHVDTDNGNTRTIDEQTCADYQISIAPDVCQLCITACPYMPSRTIWNDEIGQGIQGVAAVCDLCKSAPYWEGGGFDGTQACVSVCPMQAIALVNVTPDQRDNVGYAVNLRTENWDAVMDVPTNYGEQARSLTSPARDDRGVMRPGGGGYYDPDPLAPPYPNAAEGWPYPGPGPV